MERKQAAQRKSSHGRLVNQTLKLGKHIKTEKVAVIAWQKNWGKSISFKSPSSFQSELVRKAENAGGTVLSGLVESRIPGLSEQISKAKFVQSGKCQAAC
ncbi:MAG: hypothetical protein V7K67_15635 [Nostoc sp.]